MSFTLKEQMAATPVHPSMERELAQVQGILSKAYKKINKLDLKCRSPVVAACFLEQVQLAIASVLEPARGTPAYDNIAYAVSKVLRNSIRQYMDWHQFLDYCERADGIDKLLELANENDLQGDL